MHRLWSAAFGLGSSRHAHLAHPDPELIPSSTPWPQAPPVEVSALLRTAGRTERFSRTAKVRDIAAVKAARAERARQERAEMEAAWEQLSTDGPVRLSDIGTLDHTVFERLMDLIGRALSTRPDSATSTRRAVTGDGRVEIELRPPADDHTAVLHTTHGALTTPDYTVHIATPGSHRGTAGPGRREATG